MAEENKAKIKEFLESKIEAKDPSISMEGCKKQIMESETKVIYLDDEFYNIFGRHEDIEISYSSLKECFAALVNLINNRINKYLFRQQAIFELVREGKLIPISCASGSGYSIKIRLNYVYLNDGGTDFLYFTLPTYVNRIFFKTTQVN